jgi:hypothetical protein
VLIVFCLPQDPTDRTIKTHKSRLLTIAHEFTHILGMSSYDFPYFYSHSTGLPRTPRDEWNRPPEVEALCVDGTRQVVPMASEDMLVATATPNGYVAYEIVTETVRNVVRNQFDCRRVNGARLEVGFLCVSISTVIMYAIVHHLDVQFFPICFLAFLFLDILSIRKKMRLSRINPPATRIASEATGIT